MNNIIHSVDLTKIYGEKETSVKALDDISVELKKMILQQSWALLAQESLHCSIV